MLIDASAVVDLFLTSANSPRISRHIRDAPVRIRLCDFALGEFASAVKRERSARRLSDAHVLDIFGAFDTWRAANVEPVSTESADVRLAASFMRRLDISLRMPDAIYIATAHRLDAPLCSFDARQVAAATALGVAVVQID
jgi:predicted nucleic acid-binding protein